jgi:putative CocE/NonD family hydrolase
MRIALLAALALSTVEPSPPDYEIAMSEAWIPMPDGVRLAADLFMPSGGAAGEKFPVLLEYLPYRKTEGRGRNYPLYSYFVQRGYVVARVDIRGTGSSEGKLIDYEYTDQEQEDGEVVIDWLSKEPWSNGNVGMFGISWGGFNSIHMAMRNPPALKAIIAVDATDDLYQDDVHFMDGVLHVDSWEMSQDLDNARPGAPDYRIDEAYFRDRFDTRPWMMTYKRQQRDGPFWDRTALKTRYDSLRVPTFVIGGWYDGYRDSIPRMLQHVKAPMKALLGPWSHAFPHDPYPEPGMEWRHEAVRWFDHWLKGATREFSTSRASRFSSESGTLPARTSRKSKASGAGKRAGPSLASATACFILSRTMDSPKARRVRAPTTFATRPRSASRPGGR